MKKSAFSTIELMVTIIVVMLIMGSITPSITKKLNSRSVNIGGAIGTGTSSSIEFEPDCSHINSDCELCTTTTCMLCLKICPTGQYARTSDCTYQACSDLYGDDCLTCTNKKCKKCNSSHYIENGQCNICPTANSCNGEIKTQCEDGYYQDEQGQTSCKSCEEKDPNCKTCNQTTGVCETCKDGYVLKNGICEFDCGASAVLVKLSDRKFCMTRYNIGDHPDIPVSPAITIASAGGSTCYDTCCWSGNTVYSCNNQDSRYHGCARTLCTYYGALDSCVKLTLLNRSWQLPRKEDWKKMLSEVPHLIIGQDENSLLFCSQVNNGLNSTCAHSVSHQICYGAYENNCIPHLVWAFDTFAVSGVANANYLNLHADYAGVSSGIVTQAISARCISYVD